MNIRKIASLGVAAGLVAGGVAIAAPASADPVTGGYAAVGSDTLQDSMNALTNGTAVTGSTVRVLANGVALGNFDAFPAGLIRTKAAGGYFVRPSGSGAGVNALLASIEGTPLSGFTLPGQVDIARSSSGPGVNADTDGELVYVPYGRDAVAYAYKAATPADAAVLASLTTAQLKSIYEADAPTVINSVTINPRLPQSNSGTRSFYLGAIGVTAATLGDAVPSGDNAPDGPAENDATELGPNEIIPFSVASFVAQSTGAAPSTIGSTGVTLGSINGIAPISGSGATAAPNSAFYSTSYGRDTYLVVEYARVNSSSPTYDAALATLVNPSGGTASLVNWATALPSQIGSVKQKFGFLPPSSTTPTRAYDRDPDA
jgi:hypothetical protein